jgi:hypothetical protein
MDRLVKNGRNAGRVHWQRAGEPAEAVAVQGRWAQLAGFPVRTQMWSLSSHVRGETCCGDEGRCATAEKCNAPICGAERAREDGLGREDRESAAGAMDEGARWMWGWREKGASPMRRITAASRAGGTDARRIAAYSEQWFVDGVSGYAPSSAIARDVRGRIVS